MGSLPESTRFMKILVISISVDYHEQPKTKTTQIHLQISVKAIFVSFQMFA